MALTLNFNIVSLKFHFMWCDSDKWQRNLGWILLVLKGIFQATCISFPYISELFINWTVFHSKWRSLWCCNTANEAVVHLFVSTVSNAHCSSGVTSSFLPGALYGPHIAACLKIFACLAPLLTRQTHCYIMIKGEIDPNQGNMVFKWK